MKYMLLYVNVDFISAVLQTGGVQARPRPGLELRLRRERGTVPVSHGPF